MAAQGQLEDRPPVFAGAALDHASPSRSGPSWLCDAGIVDSSTITVASSGTITLARMFRHPFLSAGWSRQSAPCQSSA
jgi:hypothetical protein